MMKKLLMGLLAVPLLLLLGWIWFVPAVGAYICPACYGLEKVADGIYAEPGTSDIAPILAESRARVADYYGGFEHQPVLLICNSNACDERLGNGGAWAVTYGTTFIYVAPRGFSTDILSHEFSHIELHARIGLWGMITGAVPAWFDEGMAVLVSRDQRYLDPQNRAVNCETVRVEALPVSNRDWRHQASEHSRTLYHDAGCAAQARLAEKGNLAAAMQF